VHHAANLQADRGLRLQPNQKKKYKNKNNPPLQREILHDAFSLAWDDLHGLDTGAANCARIYIGPNESVIGL
jgi:hypothetical protein